MCWLPWQAASSQLSYTDRRHSDSPLHPGRHRPPPAPPQFPVSPAVPEVSHRGRPAASAPISAAAEGNGNFAQLRSAYLTLMVEVAETQPVGVHTLVFPCVWLTTPHQSIPKLRLDFMKPMPWFITMHKLHLRRCRRSP